MTAKKNTILKSSVIAKEEIIDQRLFWSWANKKLVTHVPKQAKLMSQGIQLVTTFDATDFLNNFLLLLTIKQ